MISGATPCKLTPISELSLGAARNGGSSGVKQTRFVVGEENRLLVALFEMLLTNSPGDPSEAANDESVPCCNPLTLVGPAGSGKSTLVQEIVRRWQPTGQPLTQPGKANHEKASRQVAFFTAADFGRELQVVQNDEELTSWRRGLRNLRLLVVEDLENLRVRTTIQQELCATIDAIVDRGGRVILTATREPLGLNNLHRSGGPLIDRLAAGLVLRLQSPSYAARLRLLQLASSERDLQIADDQLEKLAQRSAGYTPARLLGLITELDYATKTGLQTSSQTSNLIFDPQSLSAPSLKNVLAVVCRYLGVKPREMTSSSRRKTLVQARGIVVVLARQLCRLSYAEIGRQLGGRDHSTIINAEERIEKDRTKIPALQQALEELERILSATP